MLEDKNAWVTEEKSVLVLSHEYIDLPFPTDGVVEEEGRRKKCTKKIHARFSPHGVCRDEYALTIPSNLCDCTFYGIVERVYLESLRIGEIFPTYFYQMELSRGVAWRMMTVLGSPIKVGAGWEVYAVCR